MLQSNEHHQLTLNTASDVASGIGVAIISLNKVTSFMLLQIKLSLPI